MAKQPTASTRHVRVPEDLAEKLGEILDIENSTSSAEFLDPLIRREIEAKHTQYWPAIQAMRKARERAAKLRDESPVLANDLGDAGA